MTKNKNYNGYFAIVLDEDSKKNLSSYLYNTTGGPKFDITRMDHITLAYKPNMSEAEEFKKLLGKTCNAYINEYRRNDNIEAYFIDLMCYDSYRLSTHEKYLKRLDDGMPHITISHKRGLMPKEANSMFDKPTVKRNAVGYITGKLVYIDHNHGKKPCIMNESEINDYLREVRL